MGGVAKRLFAPVDYVVFFGFAKNPRGRRKSTLRGLCFLHANPANATPGGPALLRGAAVRRVEFPRFQINSEPPPKKLAPRRSMAFDDRSGAVVNIMRPGPLRLIRVPLKHLPSAQSPGELCP